MQNPDIRPIFRKPARTPSQGPKKRTCLGKPRRTVTLTCGKYWKQPETIENNRKWMMTISEQLQYLLSFPTQYCAPRAENSSMLWKLYSKVNWNRIETVFVQHDKNASKTTRRAGCCSRRTLKLSGDWQLANIDVSFKTRQLLSTYQTNSSIMCRCYVYA